jgi:cellulose biosynthesis protein BcsQ
MFITFYSYKGGAGRSMALANAGWILASHGKRVLLVDWDLEAPGLHRYLHPFLLDKDMVASPGVIDLMWDFVSAAMDPTGSEQPGWHEKYAQISPFAISAEYSFPDDGTLDLVPAGRQDGTYAQQVSTFDWSGFYQQLGGGAFLESLKEDIRAHYDFVLIDSRTGVSDTSGICTVQLPDVLVNCFTASTQSIEGAAAVARSIRRQRPEADLRILPVPMRIEDGENDKLEAARDYWQLLHKDYVNHEDDPARYWAEIEVPYTPYYAYEEIPAPIGDRPGQRRTVLAACESLVKYLTDGEITSVVPMPEFQRRQLQVRFHRAVAGPADWRGPEGPSKVLVCYLPSTEEQMASVRRLWLLLRENGVDAKMAPLPSEEAEPYLWLQTQLADVDFVLVIGSPELAASDRTVEASAAVDRAEGAGGAAGRPTGGFNGRVLPVLLPGGTLDDLPGYVGSISDTYFVVADFTVSGSEPLLRALTGQSAATEPALGMVPVLPPTGEDPRADIYVSYAPEDEPIAVAMAEGLSARGLGVIYLRGRGKAARSIWDTEARIGEARALVALLSPSYLASPLCRRDYTLAMCRSEEPRTRDVDNRFVEVVLIRPTGATAADFPAYGEWLDATDERQRESVLDELAVRLGPTPRSFAPAIGTGHRPAYFRDRAEEIDAVMRGLENFGGPHFWLVIAPPQFGKSWFLDQLAATLMLSSEERRWAVRLLDLRDHPAAVRADTGTLLQLLFGLENPAMPERDTFFAIAQKIIDGRLWHLCMLDSAELLPDDVARALRRCFSEIYRIVSDAGAAQTRFTVVVAGRDDKDWRGITPGPRLTTLRLGEFGIDVARDSLSSLADEMGRNFESARLLRDASRVHHLSGGLPALLTRCLAWIREQYWQGTERLDTEELFLELARPYIENVVLAPDILFLPGLTGSDRRQPAEQAAVFQGLRVLAPYRFFTLSHLSHHYALDPELSASMAEANWAVEDMWRAISGTALLTRPLDELWQEMSPAIRRLLFRYYFPDTNDRLAAHAEARSFMAVWADQQAGKEQAVGLVEVLWHEAAALQLQESPTLHADLVGSAGRLAEGLRASSAYTGGEIRDYAALRIGSDDEFQTAVGDAGLVADIIAAVTQPRTR